MKACVFHGPGDVRVESLPDPEPGPGELLLRMEATGLCHSDVRVYKGEKTARAGVIPGHENVGVIAALGEGVDGPALGRRVALCPIIACGRCYYCLRGLRNRCLSRLTLGYDENGGLAEYLRVPAALVSLGHVFPVPEGLAPEAATLTEPLACVLNSLEGCRLSPGGSLLLLGAGPMGLLHLLLARALGVATVIVSEVNEERLEQARRFGAGVALHPGRDDLARAVMEASDGLGVDAAVVTTGLPSLVEPALAAVRRQGTVSLFGGFPPGSSVALDPNAVHYNEINVTGSQNATPDQYRRALQLLTVMPQAAAVNTHRFPIDEGPRAYEARLGMDGLKSLVIF
ncbi:MAG: alcohol dehydrogenase catalytic domain-containing protein [Dehalococcoidia bacterium]|nr:alcohol dehydrogenase catalytic domain-containing protein [Dehalococcoidia bacterium]